jgi:hypothetical protein
LLKRVEPELSRLLKNAPKYGSYGFNLVFHDSEIVRISVKTKITQKVMPRSGAVMAKRGAS